MIIFFGDYVKNYINITETNEEKEVIYEVLTGGLLDDLTDTNEMFFNLAVLESTFNEKYKSIIIDTLNVYIKIFIELIFFDKITNSLYLLKEIIENCEQYNDDQLLILKDLSESTMNNLIKWKEEVIDNKISEIHYYDDAITGDINQLKVMLEKPIESKLDDDLDDIFDF